MHGAVTPTSPPTLAYCDPPPPPHLGLLFHYAALACALMTAGAWVQIVEMATGERPWPEFMENEAVMYHVGSGGGIGGGGGARPPAPAWVSDECKELLSRCFERDPEARASVKEVRFGLSTTRIMSSIPACLPRQLPGA